MILLLLLLLRYYFVIIMLLCKTSMGPHPHWCTQFCSTLWGRI